MAPKYIQNTFFSIIQSLRDTTGKWRISYISPGPGRIFPKFFLGPCLGSYIHPVSSEFVGTDSQREQASRLVARGHSKHVSLPPNAYCNAEATAADCAIFLFFPVSKMPPVVVSESREEKTLVIDFMGLGNCKDQPS
jgi:hypothetical protein